MRVFNIDITRNGISPVVQVTEYDAMSRFFTLVLRNGSSDYEPPENPNYSVWYKTKDSHGWYDTITLPDESTRPAVVADGNAYTIEIAEQATTSCGELALCITAPGGYQLTISGIITRSDDIPGYDGAEVENYYNVYITRMQENAARAENAAQTAIEYGATIDVEDETLIIDHYDDAGEVETWATVSEAWAVGKRNGVDVPSTDETYHNNSKYYAGQAANSAVNAAASAETAEEAAGLCFTTAIKTSASGAVASFADGADDIPMQSVVAEITPVQSGSGDPSPDNIRPISGRTGMTVTRANKNLAPNMEGTNDTTSNGITFTYNNDGSVKLNGTATSTAFSRGVEGLNYKIYLPHGTYKKPVVSIDASHNVGMYVQYVKGDSDWVLVTGGGRESTSFTIDEDYPIVIRVAVQNGTVADNVRFEPYVYPDSVNDLTWVSPVKTNYPISWQTEAGTVYGGTLDVVSGVLTVLSKLWTFDGTETFITGGQDNITAVYIFTDSADSIEFVANPAIDTRYICSHYKWGAYVYNPYFTEIRVGYGTTAEYTERITFMNALRNQTMGEWKQYLATQYANGTPVQVCAPLSTPLEPIQLTPTEVRTILGGNTIYTDAGSVSVEYIADTKLYIDNKIAALQALVLEN